MKYHFVWDEDFLGNHTLELSEMEMNIVIATIIGGHNAIFSGHHTERLVKAIKLLKNADIPFVSVEKPIDWYSLIGSYSNNGVKQGFVTDADKGFLHFSNIPSQDCGVTSWLVTVMENGWIKLCHDGDVVQLPANFQLIAEASYLDCNNQDIKHIVDCCDIRYDCPKLACRTLYSVETLKQYIIRAKGHRQALGRYENNSKIANIIAIDPSSVATEMIETEHISIETARLGRTLADMFGHNRTFASDLEVAKSFRNICM